MTEKRTLQENIKKSLWGLTEKDDLIDKTIADLLDLNHNDEHALALLVKSGTPVPAGVISQSLWITTGAVTALIDRLEKKGLARRLYDPTDRRRVLVEATGKAKLTTEKVFGILVERIHDLLDGYKSSELELIDEFLQKTGEIFLQRAGELNEKGRTIGK